MNLDSGLELQVLLAAAAASSTNSRSATTGLPQKFHLRMMHGIDVSNSTAAISSGHSTIKPMVSPSAASKTLNDETLIHTSFCYFLLDCCWAGYVPVQP